MKDEILNHEEVEVEKKVGMEVIMEVHLLKLILLVVVFGTLQWTYIQYQIEDTKIMLYNI